MKRMACSLTIEAVRAKSKDVTRRHPDSWLKAQPGDLVQLIEKGMGLPKGAKQVPLHVVRLVSVRVEPLLAGLNAREIKREGFDPDQWPIEAWADWWAIGHGFKRGPLELVECRRIEWAYLEDNDPIGGLAQFHNVSYPTAAEAVRTAMQGDRT